jgi:hypothetical protein
VSRKPAKRKAPTAVPATGFAKPVAPQPGNAYSIAVLNRAIDVLSVFDHARPALGLTEIVAAVQLPKTTVFRLLSSLAARGFCEFDPQTSKYSLSNPNKWILNQCCSLKTRLESMLLREFP